jgi:Na+/H+ antiporter NhaD/arsenite permease-like protein
VTAALVIFVVTYLAIAGIAIAHLRHVDRPAAAMCGAVAMVAAGVLGLDQAFAAVDLHVVTLLLGMLLIAAYLSEAKFFRLTAWLVLTRTGSARTLLWGLCLVAGGLSALLVNDTVCLMLTPLVMAVTAEAKLPPLPYLLALASSSNIGGVVTYSGNPQNMIIGQTAAAAGGPGPSFAAYLAVALPAGILCLVANAALLQAIFRGVLPRGPLPPHAPERPALDRTLAAQGIGALLLFAGLALAGVSLAGAAMTAAALLVIVARRVQPREVLARIDWPLLLFFAGLFVVVQGLAHTGVLARAFAALAPAIGRGDAVGDATFVGTTVLASNAVSNVPFVLVAVHWVPSLPDPAWGLVMLAFASTLAGNLTPFGSVANIIVLESAGPAGKVGFFRFLRYGALLTAASLAVGFGALWLERLLGWFAAVGLLGG